jgi:hypothetical protein
MRNKRIWYVIALCTLCFVAAKIVMAQDQEQDQESAPGAARISMINGQVSTLRGDSNDWVAAIVNAPMAPGDTVATAARSRAEVQLDYANILRMDQNAAVKIADLAQKHLQVQVSSGLVDYVVLKGAEADVEIDTLNMAVHPLAEGVYRIQIDADSQTELTVRKGRAEVSTQQGSTTVEKGQVIYIKGTDNPEYQIANAGRDDDWDKWNNDRDHEIEKAASWQYTNQYYTGAQDLDQYGQWVNTPDYGNVWEPDMGPDWVPYYDGRWVWEPYWGWTWVSYEPWGWAPYHYGRWIFSGGRWGWWPGRGGYGGRRPVWAPAYVSFLGFGGRHWGVSVGFGFGSIGWFPLGAYDRISPWWGHHNTYNVVGIANLTSINRFNGFDRGRSTMGMASAHYNSNLQMALNNANMRRAITTMPGDQFGKGTVRGLGHGVDAATLRQGQVVQGALPAVPTRASLMPAGRLASTSAMPSRGTTNARFFSKSPVPAGGESFSQRSAQIRQMVQQNPAGVSNTGMNSTGRFGNAAGAGWGSANRYGGANAPASGFGGQGVGVRQGAAWQRFSSRQSTPSEAQGGQASRGFAGSTSNSMTRSQPSGSFQSRSIAPQGGNQGGWQRFSTHSQPAPSTRGGGWNAPSPRSEGQSYGGYGGRPSLNIRKPIVVERSSAPRSNGGGSRSSAPSGGGGHQSSGYHGGGGGGSRGGGRR